jgi:hypothetical protein
LKIHLYNAVESNSKGEEVKDFILTHQRRPPRSCKEEAKIGRALAENCIGKKAKMEQEGHE